MKIKERSIEGKDFSNEAIASYQKIGQNDFDELWVIDS